MVLILVFLFAILLGPGYLLWLRSQRPLPLSPPTDCTWPQVDVIVPLKNESPLIEQKIKNLRSIDYPSEKLRIWFVDGASSDGTSNVVASFLRDHENFRLLKLPFSNKTHQINHVLDYCRSSWILVTDADALLPKSVLRELLAAAENRESIAVVGSLVEPDQGIPMEKWHWRFSNWLRLREGESGISSFVTAPCYLFRKSLLERLPENTISDDIHIALLAMSRGLEVILIPLKVTELRTPDNVRQLMFHKYRKSAAYFREIFRFFPQLFRMSKKGRIAFIWRASQMILLPFFPLVFLGFLPSSAVLIALASGLFIAALIAWLKFKSFSPVFHGFALAVLWVFVLPAALIGQCFAHQTANFRRIGSLPVREGIKS